MKSLSDRIRESLEMFIEEFTQELHTKGKNASGKVSESFVIENMGNGMVLSNGSMPLSVLQDGREPGKVYRDAQRAAGTCKKEKKCIRVP